MPKIIPLHMLDFTVSCKTVWVIKAAKLYSDYLWRNAYKCLHTDTKIHWRNQQCNTRTLNSKIMKEPVIVQANIKDKVVIEGKYAFNVQLTIGLAESGDFYLVSCQIHNVC